jgi:hypothetical protein
MSMSNPQQPWRSDAGQKAPKPAVQGSAAQAMQCALHMCGYLTVTDSFQQLSPVRFERPGFIRVQARVVVALNGTYAQDAATWDVHASLAPKTLARLAAAVG